MANDPFDLDTSLSSFSGPPKEDLDGYLALLAHPVMGFVHGFTTWDPSEASKVGRPDTMWEEVAHGVGQALGFVGFGPASLAKLGARGAARVLGRFAPAIVKAGAQSAIRPMRSLPMMFGNAAVRGLERGAASVGNRAIARVAAGTGGSAFRATAATAQFLQNSARSRFMVQEGIRLGAASGLAQASPLSSGDWSAGGIASNFAEGSAMGFVDGLGFGIINSVLGRAVGKGLASSSLATRRAAQMAVRSTTNAAWAVGMAQGQAALNGQTVEGPMLAYQAVMGAAFGVIDLPYEQQRAREWLYDSGRTDMARRAPEKDPTFKDLDADVQREVLFERDVLIEGDRLRAKTAAEEGSGDDAQAMIAEALGAEYQTRFDAYRKEAEDEGMDPEAAADEAGYRVMKDGYETVYDRDQEVQASRLAPEVRDRIAGERALPTDAAGQTDLFNTGPARLVSVRGSGRAVEAGVNRDGLNYVLFDEDAARADYGSLSESERGRYEVLGSDPEERFNAYVSDRVAGALDTLGATGKNPKAQGKRVEVLQGFRDAFQLDPEKAGAVGQLLDARAAVWAQVTGKDPVEYYERFESIERGNWGDVIADDALFEQAYQGSGHVFTQHDGQYIGVNGEGTTWEGWGHYTAYQASNAEWYAKRYGQPAGWRDYRNTRDDGKPTIHNTLETLVDQRILHEIHPDERFYRSVLQNAVREGFANDGFVTPDMVRRAAERSYDNERMWLQNRLDTARMTYEDYVKNYPPDHVWIKSQRDHVQKTEWALDAHIREMDYMMDHLDDTVMAAQRFIDESVQDSEYLEAQRVLYELEIFGDKPWGQVNLLDWDNPVPAHQREAIYEVLEKRGVFENQDYGMRLQAVLNGWDIGDLDGLRLDTNFGFLVARPLGDGKFEVISHENARDAEFSPDENVTMPPEPSTTERTTYTPDGDGFRVDHVELFDGDVVRENTYHVSKDALLHDQPILTLTDQIRRVGENPGDSRAGAVREYLQFRGDDGQQARKRAIEAAKAYVNGNEDAWRDLPTDFSDSDPELGGSYQFLLDDGDVLSVGLSGFRVTYNDYSYGIYKKDRDGSWTLKDGGFGYDQSSLDWNQPKSVSATVAETVLDNALQRTRGSMFKEDGPYLDTEYARAPTGREGAALYENIARLLEPDFEHYGRLYPRVASDVLVEAGILGNTYEGAGENRNFVVFRDEDVRIVKNTLFQTVPEGAKGAVQILADRRVAVRAFETGDISTVAHELGHVFRADLADADGDLLREAEKAFEVEEGKEWTVEQEEAFARGFERYLRDGEAPTKGLRSVFRKFKNWLRSIYETLKGSPVEKALTADQRAVYDRLLVGPDAEATPPTRGAQESTLSTTILQRLLEYDVPESLRGPIGDFALSVARASSVQGDTLADTLLKTANVERETLAMFDDALRNSADDDSGADPFEAAASSVLKRYGLDDGSDDAALAYAALRRTWKSWYKSTPTRQTTYDDTRRRAVDVGEGGLGTYDNAGRIVARSGHTSSAERTLLDLGVTRVFRMSRATSVDSRGKTQEGTPLDVRTVVDGEDADGIPWARATLALYGQRRWVTAPIKDKGDLVVAEDFTVTADEAPAAIDARFTALEQMLEATGLAGGEVPGLSAAADYAALKEDRVRLLVGEGVSPEEAARIVDHLWEQNVRYLEAEQGGIPWEVMAFENATGQARHLLDPLDFVKRNQVFADEAPRLDPTYQPERVQAQGGVLRTALFSAKDFEVEGAPFRGRVLDAEGRPQEHHLDGPAILRQDVFDAVVRDAGGSPDAGFVKPTAVSANATEGLFLLKGGFVRATDAEEAMMAAAADGRGVDMMVPDTAAKVTGRRRMGRTRVEGPMGGRRLVGVETFDLPVSDVRVNTGVRDAPEKIKKAVRIPRQVLANPGYDRLGPEARKRLWDAFVKPSLDGSAEVTMTVREAMVAPSEENVAALDALDPDDVSVETLSQLFFQKGRASLSDFGGAYGKVLGKIIAKGVDDPEAILDGLDEGSVDYALAEEALRNAQGPTSVAQRLLAVQALDGGITAAVVNMTPVRPYVEALFLGYLRTRALKPSMDVGAHNGIMTPHGLLSGASLAENGGDALTTRVESGRWYADEGLRALKVVWLDGRKTTLGEAYDEWKTALDDGTATPEMEARMRYLGVRVPADSPSGSRGLLFGGFTGRRGTGMAFHNEDMIAMGGADLDGDKAYVFQNPDLVGREWSDDLDSPVWDHLKTVEPEWLTDEGRAMQRSPGLVRPLRDSKENPEVFAKTLKPWQRGAVGAGDGATMWQSGTGARQGNLMLGGAATAGRRYDQWSEAYDADDTDARTIEVTWRPRRENLLPQGLRDVFTPGQVYDVEVLSLADPFAFRADRREAMNWAADASGTAGLNFTLRTIGRYLGRQAIGDVLVRDRKGNVVYEGPNAALGEAGFSASESRLWKDLSVADGLSDGWITPERGERYKGTLGEVLDHLQDVRGSLGVGGNLTYRALARLADVPFQRREGTLPAASTEGLVRIQHGIDRLFNRGSQPEEPGTTSKRGVQRTEAEALRADRLARLALLARRLTGRHALWLTDPRKTKAPSAETPELFDQDIYDVVSAAVLVRYGDSALNQGVSFERLDELAAAAEDLRLAGAEVWGRATKKKAEPDDIERIQTRVDEAFAALGDGPEADFFAASFLSSLRRQVAPDGTLESSEAYAGRRVPALVREGMTPEDALNMAKKEWWATSRPTWALGIASVPDPVVARYLRSYDEFVTASATRDGRGPQNDEVARILYGESLVGRAPESLGALEDLDPGASLLGQAPALSNYVDGVLGQVWDLRRTSPLVNDAAFERMTEGMSRGEKQAATMRREEAQRLVGDLKALLHTHPEAIKNFPGLFAGVVGEMRARGGGDGMGVTPNVASVGALKDFVDFFRDWKTGKILSPDTDPTKIPKWAYRVFPDTVGEWMRRFDDLPVPVVTWAETSEGPRAVRGYTYQSSKGFLVRFASAMNSEEDRVREDATLHQNEAWRWATTAEVKDPSSKTGWSAARTSRLVEAVVAKMEDDAAGREFVTGQSSQRARDAVRREYVDSGLDKVYQEARTKTFRYIEDGREVEVQGDDFLRRVLDTVKAEPDRIREEHLRLGEKSARWFRRADGKGVFSDDTMALLERGRRGNFTDDDLAELFSPERIADINVEQTLAVIQRHYEVEGQMAPLTNDALSLLEYRGDLEHVRVGTDKVSAYDLRREGRHEEADQLVRTLAEKRPWRPTGYVSDGYWPRLGHAENAVRAFLREQGERLAKEDLTDKERQRILLRYRRAYQAGTIGLRDLPDVLSESVLAGREARADRLEELGLDQELLPSMEPGNVLSRSDLPLPGWDKSPRALREYEQRLLHARHKRLFALVSDRVIRGFEDRAPMGEDTAAWAEYLRHYVREQVGRAGVVPEWWLDGSDEGRRMGLDKSAVRFLTTNKAEGALRKLDTALGGVLARMGVAPERGSAPVTSDAARRWENRLSGAARLEAKVTFLGLLARPKAFFYNLTQAMHTQVSVGWDPFLKAMNQSYWQRALHDPDRGFQMQTFGDLLRFAERHGVVDQMFAAEVQMPRNSPLSGDAYRDFRVALSGALRAKTRAAFRRGENVSDEALQKTVMEVSRQYGVGERLIEVGGLFMRSSERILRAHSFLAHYIAARKALFASKADFEPEDPHLIRLARRGVEATQFMYDDSIRPFFARGPVGKVASRFQMWSWQSVRFQRDVYNAAKRLGFKEGTPEMDRFQRLATYDVLSFALMTAFPASIFGAGAPQPVGWIGDFAQWAFSGDDEERQRAFVGGIPFGTPGFRAATAPVGMVTPPASRYLLPLSLAANEAAETMGFEWLMNATTSLDDVAAYETYSIAPFGLAAYDVKNVVTSPLSLVDRMTGVPLFQIGRGVQKIWADDKDEGNGFVVPGDTRFGL